jgi:hypothetical protein
MNRPERTLTPQGHTPDFEKIVHKCNGTIIIIDTGEPVFAHSLRLKLRAGISSAYGGVHSALEISYTLRPSQKLPSSPDHHQDPFVADPDTTASTTSYIEREEVYAIYPDSRVKIVTEEREVKA